MPNDDDHPAARQRFTIEHLLAEYQDIHRRAKESDRPLIDALMTALRALEMR